MKVVFRVDASVHIGCGHVMRCLALAKGLRNRSVSTISFACQRLPSDMRAYIESQGFPVTALSVPQKIVVPLDNADYQAWLQRTQREDVEDFLNHIKDADWVVTDHYAIDAEWQSEAKSRLDCQLLAIDDLVRKHQADIVLDQTLNRHKEEYDTDGVVLPGTDFALLTQQFSEKRVFAEKRVLRKEQPRVLISMGGVDASGTTLRILRTLDAIPTINCTVLLNERSPYFDEVVTWCANRDRFNHIAFTNHMSDMMLDHDIAIGAPGSTSWERACLGLPSVIIPLAENQKEICQQLVDAGASVKVDIDQIECQLSTAVDDLLSNWPTYVKRNLCLCDGQGVERVVNKIMEMNFENHTSMQ